MSAEGGGEQGPFRYHLELTPSQLKITYTALHSLLDDFGHEESDIVGVIKGVLAKLPDEHAIRAIRLEGALEDEIGKKRAAPPPDDESPGPSAA